MKNHIKWWLILLMFLAACRQPHEPIAVTRAFYYWKSILTLSPTEKQALQTLLAKKIYVKFFDVVWDAGHQRPLPVAKVRFTDSTAAWLLQHGIAIIPTVFITNECMLSIDSNHIPELAGRIHELLSSIAGNLTHTAFIPEIQMDCDWTATSRDKYFSLLGQLQPLPFFRQKTLSATIRLYQCKYRYRTGVPPVNRGLLMCYNMGNLKNQQTHNSILEAAELEKYIGNLSDYPLPLDIALPLFDWKVLYRNQAYTGLIQGLPDSLLNHDGISLKTSSNTFTMLQDTILNGYSLKKGDHIRQEDATFDELMRATRLLRSKLVTPSINVALYHLDSLTLHKYSSHELEEVFNSLR